MHENWLIIASGPGADRPDALEAFHAHRARGLFSICTVNNAFELIAPDMVYSHDEWWWREYYHRAKKLGVPLYGAARNFSHGHDINLVQVKGRADISKTGDWVFHGGNSGTQAIDLLRIKGAKRIGIFGFAFDGTRWHGKHKDNEAVPDFAAWRKNLARLARHYKGTPLVTNLSSPTTVDCFPLATPQQWIEGLQNADS